MSPRERQTAERDLAKWRRTRVIFRGMLADERNASPALFLNDAPRQDAPLYLLTMWRCVSKIDVIECVIPKKLAPCVSPGEIRAGSTDEGDGQ